LVLERKPNATTPIGNLAPLVKKDEVLSKFVVDVDPKHNYRIVRNESYVSNKSQQALFDVYEFAYLANQSHDFPESTSATVNGPKGREPGGQSKLVSFTPTAPPPEEFTLRFYGLGSPFPVKSIFFSRWLWLGIAALLTLFLYRAWSARHAAVN
jgi:hypothetical protein